MPLHVELINHGDDADELEAVLRAAGFEVARVGLTELGRHGAASVVDVSQTGADAAIEALLSHGAHPVVRLGGSGDVDGVLGRPVGHDALLVALRRAMAQTRSSHASDQAVTVTQDAGRTFHPGIELATAGPGLALNAAEIGEARPSELLEAALRREGGETLLDSLGKGQADGPLDLAPDVLFDFPMGPGDELHEEHELSALERSLPDLSDPAPQPVLDAQPGVSPDSELPREGWLGLDDATLGAPDPTGSFRTGQTAPLGMVRLLWRIAELGLDLELDATFQTRRLLLRYLAGGLRELRGERHLQLVRRLGLPATAHNEREAQALLDAELHQGRLSRFEIAHGLRVAGETQLGELALSTEAHFTLRPLPPRDARRLAETPAPLARPALVLLGQAARHGLGLDTLERLAAGAPRLRFSPEVHIRLQQAEVEPELREVLLRHDGGRYRDLLDEVGEGVGVAGLLCVLAVLDAARFVRDSNQPE